MGIKISLQDQIAEVKYEIGMRQSVYPRLVMKEHMTRETAKIRTERMLAVLQTLEKLREAEILLLER